MSRRFLNRDRVRPSPPRVVDTAPRVADRPVQPADLPGNFTQLTLRKFRTLQQLRRAQLITY
jgi:hypothetical protein